MTAKTGGDTTTTQYFECALVEASDSELHLFGVRIGREGSRIWYCQEEGEVYALLGRLTLTRRGIVLATPRRGLGELRARLVGAAEEVWRNPPRRPDPGQRPPSGWNVDKHGVLRCWIWAPLSHTDPVAVAIRSSVTFPA